MKLASIERIVDIFPHPNAEKLEFAQVLGYRCIIPKATYHVGDLIILIQPDTVLPEADWTETYQKFSKTRVKAMKLRGEWSFGIVEKLSLLPPDFVATVGEDVSEFLGITKYEAPQPQVADAKGFLPYAMPKTDEDRYQNLLLEELWGSPVDVTLKVDGQSFTAYYKAGEFGVCGRTLEYKLEGRNDYVAHADRYSLASKLQQFCEQHQVNIALRGESYGQGIQSSKLNPHSQKPKGIAFFSVYLIDENRYAYRNDPYYVRHVCQALDLPTVPFLETAVPLTRSLIQQYDEGLENLQGENFEGVVIVGDHFSFKVVNKYYDSLRKI
jgi:RNA ligase (TIGR02306 family)